MKKSIKISIFLVQLFFIFIAIFINKGIAQNIEVGFSPGNSANNIILMAIKNSKKSIDVAAYSFTSKSIATALVKAYNRGVKVRVVADKRSNHKKYTAVNYLANHHILVKLNDKYTIMHNKFMIFDRNSVETGSFNYTRNAVLKNAENVIYLKNQLYIVEKYISEFNRLWNESVIIKESY